MVTFDLAPTIVPAGDQNVDFLEEVLADVTGETGPGLGVEGEAPGIP